MKNMKYKIMCVALFMAIGLITIRLDSIALSDEPEQKSSKHIETMSLHNDYTMVHIGENETKVSVVEENTSECVGSVLSEENTNSETLVYSYDWDDREGDMLARIAMAEAENQGVEGKALVILVVLNRVWSDSFPDTIEEVIFQKNQFSPVSNGRYDRVTPDAECYEAINMIVHGWDESKGALYFESKGKSSWHKHNLEFLFKYKDHNFYKEKE